MAFVDGVLGKLQRTLFSDFDVYQLIRLVIIVGGYIIIRTRATEYFKTKQLKAQLEKDKEEKARKLVDDPTGEVAQAEAEELFQDYDNIRRSEKSWGWGKATRKRVKKQQALFEKEIEKAAVEAQRKLNSGYDSDEELNELLHD